MFRVFWFWSSQRHGPKTDPHETSTSEPMINGLVGEPRFPSFLALSQHAIRFDPPPSFGSGNTDHAFIIWHRASQVVHVEKVISKRHMLGLGLFMAETTAWNRWSMTSAQRTYFNFHDTHKTHSWTRTRARQLWAIWYELQSSVLTKKNFHR